MGPGVKLEITSVLGSSGSDFESAVASRFHSGDFPGGAAAREGEAAWPPPSDPVRDCRCPRGSPRGLNCQGFGRAACMRQEGNRSSTVLGSHLDGRRRLELLGQANRICRSLLRRIHSATGPRGICPLRPKASETIVDRAQKQKLVNSLHGRLKKTELVVVTQQVGMTVAEVTTLRRQMREAGAGFKVTKNRLARRALEGTKFASWRLSSRGPRRSPIRPTRWPPRRWPSTTPKRTRSSPSSAGRWAARCSTPTGVKALATLPSLNELRGKLVGMLHDAGDATSPWSCRRRPASSRVSWVPMRTRPGPRHRPRPRAGPSQTFKPIGEYTWLICRNWLTSSRS